MPTIKDVAREAGVSIATVSYVLNGKTSMVSEETFQHVSAVARRIGYVPNVTARNLKSSQSRLIGYAWHSSPADMVHSVLDLFMFHLAQAAEAAGYHLLTFTYPSDDPIPVYEDLINSSRVDAFVLASTEVDDPRIQFLLERKFPFVSFGRTDPRWDFPWVDTDGTQGVRDAVDYLARCGHERIAMIAWPEESISGEFRVAGYYAGLEQAGIPFRSEYLVRGEHSLHAGHQALAQLCSLPREQWPTAIIAVSDLTAIGVITAAEAWGLTAGQTLSVIGFDDAPFGQYVHPPLTTLRQPLPEISQTLIEMLQATLNNQPLAQRHVLLPPRLVIRQSSGLRGHP